ncbi:quinol:cytochrome C oxidoreductase [bacterium]|nr:quinol:cytochrome C oxidoreductase [bacterium]
MSSKTDVPRLTGFLANALPNVAIGLGALGLAATAVLWKGNAHHTAFSYLFAFLFFLSITIGSLFFVIIQHLARAGWSVVVRRIPETFAMNAWLMAVFFIPVIFGMHELYHWTHPEAVASDHLLAGKAGYLNVKFFLIRAVLFFGIWIAMARFFYKKSVAQDQSGDKQLTLSMQAFSAVAILLFAISVTFGIIDWAMSLTPHWYSTMFGVYFFAGSAVAAFATMSLVALLLRRFGFLADVIRTDHYHDIAKFLYGLNIFWAYVSFSQYFLIWYANIPEESVWFMQHFNGSWNTVAATLAIGHFFVPFVLFMSKHMRRNLVVHAALMVWFLMMHCLDLYWLVMPNISPNGIHPTLADLTSFVGIGGIFVGVFWLRLRKASLMPARDPRLSESLHHHT